MPTSMIGWAHTKFGRLDDEDIESLIVRVAMDALSDAGLEPADVDEIFVGTMNGGFVKQGFPASLVHQASDDFRFTPSTHVENACATGSAAIHQGLNAIDANKARVALAIGVEKMTEVTTQEAGDALLGASYVKEEAEIDHGFAGVFAEVTQRYFQQYGDKSSALAKIAAKNHANGMNNPLAHFRKDFGYRFCNEVSTKNPYVAPPLRRTDCSAISDGAAAVVLAADDIAATAEKAVDFRAAVQVNDFLPMRKRDVLKFEGPARAWSSALADAGIALEDLSFAEVHDCFTIAELLIYEAMGLAPQGQGARVVEEGTTTMDGRLPVNASGGLKAKGHPVGATGVSMHVLAAKQLTGEAGGIQIPGAALGGILNMGGMAVANYVSILEPRR